VPAGGHPRTRVIGLARPPRPPARILVAAGAVAAVVAAAAGGAWWWSAAAAQRAMSAYAAALAQAQQAQASAAARAAAVAGLEAALARYPSAAVADQAAFELGNLRYRDRDWPRARAAYEIALARSGSPTLRTLARLGLGYTWEAEKNYPKALEAYRAALTGLKPGDFEYEELLLDVARVQELAGKTGEAIATYRRILRELPRGRRVDDVRSRLASLGATP